MSTNSKYAIGLAVLLAACSSSNDPTTPTTSTTGTKDAGTSTSTTTTKDAGGTSTEPTTDSGTTVETPAGTTAITGKLGALGDVKPTVSSLWISNSGETLIYMSSAPITCDLLANSRWLGSATKGSQVIEVVVKGAAKLGEVAVPPGEVNFAEGGKSSAYEVNADSGKITFSKSDATTIEGTLAAVYGSDNISGSFHAEFCKNGQGY